MTNTRGARHVRRRGHEAVQELINALRNGRTLPAVRPQVQRVLDASVHLFSHLHSPRYLVRLATEVVPTHPRDVSAVRARMGTLIELFLANVWNELIDHGDVSDWRVSVNYVTEYPHLYLRDENGDSHLRIETKALHDEADEGAARFDTVTPPLDPSWIRCSSLGGSGWRSESARTVSRFLPS